jgi:Mg/Co/Ni transporter MgtE
MHVRASANKAVDDWSPEDLADLIVHMPLDHARTFLDWLPKQKASRVLADMHRDNRAALSRRESEGHLSELLEEMPPDVALDTFRSLPKRMKGRMASLLTDFETLQDARKYPEGTVGHIMDRRIVAVPLSSIASEAVEAIKAAFESKGTVGTIYVLDADKIPVGVFRPRDLLAVPPDTPIRDFMQKEFPVVRAEARHDDAAHTVEGAGYMSLPVVDSEGRLIGQITPKLRERIIAEERRKAPGRSDRRHYRRIHHRLVRGRARKSRYPGRLYPCCHVDGREFRVAGLGCFGPGPRLGLHVAGRSPHVKTAPRTGRSPQQWSHRRDNPGHPFSLMSVTTIAALVGSSVPFALNRFGIDPAAATGVFITTSNDVLGVLVYFTMADVFYF